MAFICLLLGRLRSRFLFTSSIGGGPSPYSPRIGGESRQVKSYHAKANAFNSVGVGQPVDVIYIYILIYVNVAVCVVD